MLLPLISNAADDGNYSTFRSCIVRLHQVSPSSELKLTPPCTEVTRGHSAIKSGIDLLPLMLSIVFSVIVGGQIVARIGRYVRPAVAVATPVTV